MGAESSKGAQTGAGPGPLPVLTFPTDINVPEVGAPAAEPADAEVPVPKASSASDLPENGGRDASLDQLPSVPAATAANVGSSIMRDFGDYRLEKQVLGEGAFGKVRLATSTRTAHRVAVKVIKRKKLNERAEVLLQREVKHHEKLRHANIVRLHTFIVTPTKYYLVMEYCEGGDLLVFINGAPLLSDELARTLFVGLLEGIRFCHVLGIHHRDLKLENLMLTSRDERTMQLKIADFGLSDLQTLPSSLSSTFCGSPLYAAPELMTAGAAPDGYDAVKSDIWSCGVILYALLASALPFDAEDICALVRLIQLGVPNSPVPEARGPLAADLVRMMLNTDPKTRPLADAVLAHEWAKPVKAGIKSSPASPRGRSSTGDTERPKGKVMTRGELEALKEAAREEEAKEAALAAVIAAGGPIPPELMPAPAPAVDVSPVEEIEPPPVVQEDSEPARRGGQRMTEEEWAEIRRERQKEKEAKQQQ